MKIIYSLLIVILFVLYYFVDYLGFQSAFKDDIYIYCGRKWKKGRYKNKTASEKIKAFFFIDVCKDVIGWHYAFFWIHLLSWISVTVLVLYYYLSGGLSTLLRIILYCCASVNCITEFSCGFTYYYYRHLKCKSGYLKMLRKQYLLYNKKK